MGQDGSYGKGEIEFVVEHDNTVLLEIQDFKYDFDVPKAATGSGLGALKNLRHKRTGPAKGTWSMSRNMLAAADKGSLFLGLLAGSARVITENVAINALTHTPAQGLVGILSIRLMPSKVGLTEGIDYTVNYATGIITFAGATTLSTAGEVKYLSDDADRLAPNLIQDGGFEADTTNIWEAISCTFARGIATPYAGTYTGSLSAINAANDGLKYLPDITVVPGRTYQLSFYAKAAAADDAAAKWTDAGGSVAMTPVTGSETFATTWKLHEFTFVPDEATIMDIQILNSDTSPGATLLVDEVYLVEAAPTITPMDAGNTFGFNFNVVGRRKEDGTQVFRCVGCEAYKVGFSSGDVYKEDISGEFLEFEGES